MRLVTLPALLALAACTSVESDTLTTEGMYADMWVVAEGDGASRAVAILRAGGAVSNTFVELVGDDTLTAAHDGEEPVPMIEQQLGEARSYRADFTDDTPDLDVHINFERTLDDGAPDSVMSLPQPFALDPIAESFSRDDDDIVLTWDNQQDEEIAVWIEGSCIENQYRPSETDAGTHTIAADSLEPLDDDALANCEIAITVWRSRPGTVDTGYGEGGIAWGHQTRALTTLSIP